MSKILCIDFDGVLHSYVSGWQGVRCIPDPPVPCALDWLRGLIDPFLVERVPENAEPEWEVCIYSSRSRQWGGRRAMKAWLRRWGLEESYLREIRFPTKKPAAYLTIDDRAICFEGTFPSPDEMRAFRPWNKKA